MALKADEVILSLFAGCVQLFTFFVSISKQFNWVKRR
jgi:hypothetical protein